MTVFKPMELTKRREVTANPRALILDAHGVLLLPDGAAYRASMEPFGLTVSDEQCRNVHYQMMQLLDVMTEDDWPFVHRQFASALGVPLELQAQLAPILNENYLGTAWEAAPGARNALVALENAGYSLAVASNVERGGVEAILSALEICGVEGDLPRVSIVLDSHVLGFGKPDFCIYQMALDAMGASPTETIHVGDSLHSDIAGALNAGIAAVHIDPLGSCGDSGHTHAVSLQELASRLLDS
jgi:putative hydrolase of the HAD superfamily